MAFDDTPAPLTVRHRPWDGPPSRPAMANAVDRRPGLTLTNRSLERAGRPVVPVSGEIHYSRVPRSRWAERLRLMRSGGITVVATYVFWIHHVERRDEPRLEANLDVGAFVDLCQETGLDVVLRIGPWCHGEVRHGGFPDWVQEADVAHRTDDPGYLDLVRTWFTQLAGAVADRCGPDGPIIGIQVENELYDRPGHLVTVKRLAREAGLVAPIWTATAWGGAQLPDGEVLPLYGGYGDGFWVDADQPWDPTFRAHYLFSHEWDDPGIGADVRLGAGGVAAGPHGTGERVPSTLFPPATCELGGGMATAYHRRPRPAALDVAAVAHVKLGNGSAWQGYYMYAGGTNPLGAAGPAGPGLQESQATGYPNDLPRLSYDFHAPVGEAGELAPSHAELRLQHAFLAAFGSELVSMPSSLPEAMPSGVEDVGTLRWALRSDGSRGVLFIGWHQPHVPLDPYPGARFTVELEGTTVTLPSRPVTVPPGTLARWPVCWEVGGVRLEWATASLLTVLEPDDGVPTLVLVAEEGIDVEVALAQDGGGVGAGAATDRPGMTTDRPAATSPEIVHVQPSTTPLRLTRADGALDLLVLEPGTARAAWVCEAGHRRLLLSRDPLTWDQDGVVHVRSAGDEPEVRVYDPVRRAFAGLSFHPEPGAPPVHAAQEVAARLRRGAGQVPPDHGARRGRQSAPAATVVDALSAVYDVELPAWAREEGRDAVLSVDWAGDVGELRVDGTVVADRFWDGSRWVVSLRDVGVGAGSAVTLHLLPLSRDSAVALPGDAAARRDRAEGQLLAVDRLTVSERRWWREA